MCIVTSLFVSTKLGLLFVKPVTTLPRPTQPGHPSVRIGAVTPVATARKNGELQYWCEQWPILGSRRWLLIKPNIRPTWFVRLGFNPRQQCLREDKLHTLATFISYAKFSFNTHMFIMVIPWFSYIIIVIFCRRDLTQVGRWRGGRSQTPQQTVNEYQQQCQCVTSVQVSWERRKV